jgi:hypothetical protein
VFVLGFNPGATGTAPPFPPTVTQTPEAVARELVRGRHRRRQPRVVAGGINRLMLFGMRWLSRKVGVNIMGLIGPLKS